MKQTIINRTIALLLFAALFAAAVFSTASAALAAGAPDVIYINTADDFAKLAKDCTLDTWSRGKQVVLQADIYLTNAQYSTIPTFGGTFDGNGHIISGLNVSMSASPCGLFNVLQEGAEIKNLKVKGEVTPSGDGSDIGGIVGENYGTVTGCTFTGTVCGKSDVGGIVGINAATGQIIECRAKGSVTGDGRMTGGIVGCNLGIVEGCINNASVNTDNVDSSRNLSDINFDYSHDVSRLSSGATSSTTSDTGGIAGYSSGILANCANSGTIGYQHIGYNVGGIVGRSCGYIYGCENRGEIFGRKDVGGIAGQMEPYVAEIISDSTVAKLEQRLDELDEILDAAMDDLDCGIDSVDYRLNKIADYMESARDAICDIHTSAGAMGTLIGSSIEGRLDSLADILPKILDKDGEGEEGGEGSGTGGEEDGNGDAEDETGGEEGGTGGAEGEDTAAGEGKGDTSGNSVYDGTTEGDTSSETGGDEALPQNEAEEMGEGEGGEGEEPAPEEGTGGEAPQVEKPDLKDITASMQLSLTTSINDLSSAISGMVKQMRLLDDELSDTSDSLRDDLDNVFDKIDDIADVALETLDDEEDRVTDSSEVGTDLVTLGKAHRCENSGHVDGDINAGGIAGAMAMEYELDPEDDIIPELDIRQSRRWDYKAIIKECVNNGEVQLKSRYAGGICGRMDLGLIADCECYGSVLSEDGDYIGGIAGLAGSTVRRCFAKCALSGNENVGGIVGSGVDEDSSGDSSTVYGCYSMVRIDSCAQFAGAVSGADAGDFSENYFISESLAGINGRSYSGRAEPVSYPELLKRAGVSASEDSDSAISTSSAIPDDFLQLLLMFVVDEETVETVLFEYGADIDETVYPEIPEEEGYYSRWDRGELKDLRFDTVVTAVYEPYISALPSAESRIDGRPIFLVEGLFDDGDALETTAIPNTPEDFAFIATGRTDCLAKSFSGSTVGRDIAEQWKISIPDDGQETHTVRYLPPDADPESLDIYVKEENGWQKAETDIIGSCMVFSMEGAEAEIAAISTADVWWVRLLAGILLLILLVLIFYMLLRRDKSKKTKKGKRHKAV